jgi:uncharacterized protein YihD (DUF1040 family)
MKVNELIARLQQLVNTEPDLSEVDIKLETEPTYKNSIESDIDNVWIHEWYDSKTKKKYKTVILVEKRDDNS